MTRFCVPCLVLTVALATQATLAAEPTLAEERAFQAAVARVESAVVRIEPLATSAEASRGDVQPGSGPATGLIIAPGRVLTTGFAIPDDVEETLVVLADGSRRVGRVRGRDRSRGLVLLTVADLPPAPPLEPAARRDLAPGQWAIAVGRGWSATTPSIAVGIVSALNRAWGKAVQTDAAVSPMNYGGPLIDIHGRVIGLVAPLPADTAGLTEGTELYDAGIGFAVPLEDLLASFPRLDRGELLAPGILGIGYRSRDEINGEPVIASVQPGSPAAAAGLEPGDRLVSIDDRPIARIADARHAIAPRYAGDEIAITVSRDQSGEAASLTLRATLVDRLPPWRRAVIGGVPVASLATDAGGIRLAWLTADGPAAAAGLRAGDILTGINAGSGPPTPADSPAAVAGVLAGMLPGGHVQLRYRRSGRETTVELETARPPADLPPTGLEAPAAGIDPLAGPLAAATIVRLEAADVAEPAIAVVPAGEAPVGVLIWCGPPHGRIDPAEAAPWQAAAARYGIAVILPGSGGPAAWSRDDVPTVVRSLATLDARRPIDPRRIGVAGREAGAAFAWLVAERLGDTARGVALVGGGLPRLAAVAEARPGRDWWILLGPGGDEAASRLIEADRRRLDAAGYAAGLLPPEALEDTPAEPLCRWASLLGIL
ncbi:MAG: putative periplasmic serine endoprotease DegP-like precursor [Planctomycetota bacterium]